ncbi:MAG: hypothetical protein M1320_02635 [Patescibacteria group bacterium]|nr:hypothetical protein [Patescibacteria group bacterium]
MMLNIVVWLVISTIDSEKPGVIKGIKTGVGLNFGAGLLSVIFPLMANASYFTTNLPLFAFTGSAIFSILFELFMWALNRKDLKVSGLSRIISSAVQFFILWGGLYLMQHVCISIDLI